MAAQEKAGWPVVTVVMASEKSISRFRKAFIGEEPGSGYADHPDLYQVETYVPQSAVTGLVGALEEAVDMVHDWAFYASEYFQEKHDLEGDLEKLKRALSTYKQEVE